MLFDARSCRRVISIHRTGTMDASTDSWGRGGAQMSRWILDRTCTFQEFVQIFEELSHAVVFTDSDHAGCLRTRRNISSSKLFYASHVLRFTSTTQAVISLISGESEFHALVK